MKTVIYGFLGCGGLAGAAFLWTMFSNKKSNILQSIYKGAKNILQKKVEQIEETQGRLKIQIDNKEDLSQKSKEKIAKIVKKSSTDIQNILREDNIQKIEEEVDREWSNL